MAGDDDKTVFDGAYHDRAPLTHDLEMVNQALAKTADEPVLPAALAPGHGIVRKPSLLTPKDALPDKNLSAHGPSLFFGAKSSV